MEDTRNIHELIEVLLDLEHQFPTKLLYQFSDLNTQECKVLASSWETIPLKRRQTLMQDLVSLAENDPVLMYERVANIALDDVDPQVQLMAIDLLFDCEDRRLIPVFLKMLADKTRDEEVRAAVANVLGPFVYMGEVDKLKPEILEEIEGSLLKAYFKDESDLVRRRALEALGFSSREEVPALIRKAGAMSDELWLESAMFAMGRSADEQWEPSVLENLDHENVAVRIQAVHAAGELALKKARRTLLQSVSEIQDETLRHETIWALAQIGGEGVERKLEALLAAAEDDEEAEILEEALEILNFTEGGEEMELMSVSWDKTELHTDEDEEDDDYPDDDDEYEDSDAYDDDEWLRYVDDDDEEDDDDEFSYGEFDEDRFS